jgi:hypothetical protein
MWTTLDYVVLHWIYSTISFDLLTTIMEKGSTAMAAGNGWLVFLKTSHPLLSKTSHPCAVALEQDFSSTKTHVPSLLSKTSHLLVWRIFLMYLPIVSASSNFLIS